MTDEERAARFMDKVSMEPNSGCWLWTGCTAVGGYGLFAGSRAHRWIWSRFMGQIPAGLFVCHHCDNPPCVNPAHLFLGSPTENNADRHRKGRSVRGESGGRAKLTETDVVAIRLLAAEGIPQRRLAQAFTVAESNISHIVNGLTWTHL